MKIRNKPYRGTNRKWGVKSDGVLYEPIFTKAVASRIAELENRPVPPKDWEHTEEILLKEGYRL